MKAVSIISILLSVVYGEVFQWQELNSTGFAINIAIGPDATMLNVIAPADTWHAVGSVTSVSPV